MAPQSDQPKAVCLLSGGLDSSVTLAEAHAAGFETYAISVDYGQRHEVELAAAARVAEALGAKEHRVVKVDLSAIGGSALTDDIEVPKDRPEADIGDGVPITYVPARNSVFLSMALGWAELLKARDLFIGANIVDYSGYPDCRPEFLQAFEALAQVATVAGAEAGAKFRVQAPLLKMTKAEVVARGVELGVDLSLTHSCYDPVITSEGPLACGRCDTCILRLAGFKEAGVEDPIPYAEAASGDG